MIYITTAFSVSMLEEGKDLSVDFIPAHRTDVAARLRNEFKVAVYDKTPRNRRILDKVSREVGRPLIAEANYKTKLAPGDIVIVAKADQEISRIVYWEAHCYQYGSEL